MVVWISIKLLSVNLFSLQWPTDTAGYLATVQSRFLKSVFFLLHCNFTTEMSNSRFLVEPIFVSPGGSRNRDFTVFVLHSSEERPWERGCAAATIKWETCESCYSVGGRAWQERRLPTSIQRRLGTRQASISVDMYMSFYFFLCNREERNFFDLQVSLLWRS